MGENDPSTGQGATPAPVPPVMGTTPAPVGATPAAAPSLTLEEALKKLADIEHAHTNKSEELERHRKKLTAYEKAEAQQAEAKRLADEAQLSEIERVKKQHEATEQQAQRYKQRFINTSVKLAAKDKGIIDPELAAMAITSSLEYDKDGMPTNVDEALDALIKSKPYLAPKPADPPTTPAQSAPSAHAATPALPAMNPGRAQITPPGSLPTGKPVRLSDIRNRRP